MRSSCELVEVDFYSKHAKKGDIWEDMVLNTIGTKTGKIKTVIADSRFFCYDIFKVSREYRMISVIKIRKNINLNKFWKIAGTMQIKLEFSENKSTKLAQVLIEDIRIIVTNTVENSLKECLNRMMSLYITPIKCITKYILYSSVKSKMSVLRD